MYHLTFDKARFDAFVENDQSGPVHMLNLVRYREWASYEDGRKATGAEAYAAYGRESAPVLARVGGRVIWRGTMEMMMIGPDDKQWDLCFIVEYPDAAAFATMVQDPEYRTAVVHRQAALIDSRLIRMAPLDSGADFAGSG